ncbi:MAG: hypothetical protein ACLU0O_08110 [Collinsella sp.]
MFRFWSTTTSAPEPARSSTRSMSSGLLASSALKATPSRIERARAVRALPDVDPEATGVSAAGMVYPLLSRP